MILVLTIIAIIFTFYAPLYLKSRKNDIRPTKNIFDKFVENDKGYPWSLDPNRIKSYQKELAKRIRLKK